MAYGYHKNYQNYQPKPKLIPPADVVQFLKFGEGVTKNEFLLSLAHQLDKNGVLTQAQIDAVKRNISNAAGQKAEPVKLAVNVEKIEKAFEAAKASGLKRPKLHLGDFLFKPAPQFGKNPGSIYVTEGEQYLGRVFGGEFIKAGQCSDEQLYRVVKVCNDPFGEAIKHGKLTGNCACCGKALSDPKSVEMGIGPICAKKYGFL
jgi:hypothetical protein